MFCVYKEIIDETIKLNDKVIEKARKRIDSEEKIKEMNYPTHDELFAELNMDRKTFASILKYFSVSR